MDSIVRSYLDSFCGKFNIDKNLSESKRFEYFSIFSILSDEINSNLDKNDLESIILPDGTRGIDGISVTINDALIFNADEIDNFKDQRFSVSFHFFQVKISESFSDSEVGSFLDTIIDFFSEKPNYNIQRDEYSAYLEIYKRLLQIISSLKEVNLFCYYISLGQKQESNTTIDCTIKNKRSYLEKYNFFTNIHIQLIDKAILISKHKKAISPLKSEFKFENKISLSGIPSIEEAYIGYVSFSEFKKLIIDNENNKIKSLFNDNLRDFLGFDNPINQNIKQTLENRKFSEFSLLNNGITVIAESNSGRGNTLVLENYQIVNGCQTSNVLYECRNIEGIDNVLIPLKVIITKDENLRDEIIITTNSQSSFTEEQLFAITQFQKELEDYYISQKDIDGIYYERRTNQYQNINKSKIVDIKEQLKSFMAMFFDVPHLVSGNIGKVIKQYKDKFFQKDHSPIPYYISGLLSKKWDELIQSESNYKEFNKFRYHIFMGFRYLVEDLPFDQRYLSKSNIKQYAIKSENQRINSYEKLLQVLRDRQEVKRNLDNSIEIFKKVDYTRQKAAYSGPITEEYKQKIQGYLSQN
jgi:hypothetical protein